MCLGGGGGGDNKPTNKLNFVGFCLVGFFVVVLFLFFLGGRVWVGFFFYT